jgi:hypothetical protein
MLSVVQEGLQSYFDKVYSRSNINLMWTQKNFKRHSELDTYAIDKDLQHTDDFLHFLCSTFCLLFGV